MPASECRECGGPIIWGETAKGRRMPLDPDPTIHKRDRGVVVMFEGKGGTAQVRPYDQAVDEIAARNGWPYQRARDHVDSECDAFPSHFSTCPEGGDYRRIRKGTRR